jgi:hypothetical protein
MASYILGEAQTIPGYIQNLPLKPNQIIAPWGYNINRFDINTYLDDSLMNDRSIDSLVSDSKHYIDSIVSKLGPDCDYLGFRYHNRLALDEESSIRIAYWLKNGVIVRIDSFRSEHFKANIKFPLLSNQYLDWYGYEIPSENIFKNEFIFCNIISGHKNMEDSLKLDNNRILMKLLKAPLKKLTTENTGPRYTLIRIRYISQLSGDIIKEYEYPLTPNYTPDYYIQKYKNTE